MSMMKFYFNPVSGPCRKAYIVALHLGVELEEKFMDFAKQDHKSPEFMKLNPNGKIPALVDGDLVLWESNAICQYLCSQKAGQTLWPADARTQADISRWMFWQTAHFGPALAPFNWENFLKARMGMGETDEKKVKDAEPEFHRFAKVLDNHLRGREFLVGKSLTLADIVVGTSLIYKEAAKLPIGDYKNILDWYARLEQLEAWKKSAPKR